MIELYFILGTFCFDSFLFLLLLVLQAIETGKCKQIDVSYLVEKFTQHKQNKLNQNFIREYLVIELKPNYVIIIFLRN